MRQYLDLVSHVLEYGNEKEDRTGTGTKSVFGYQMRFNLSEGFPMLTTKKLNLKSIIYELLWFLTGDTNIKYLKDNGVSIWTEWADENGNLGPVYEHQWRNWNNDEIDQIKLIIESLKNNPNSRRMLVSAWNPSVLPDKSKSFSKNVADQFFWRRKIICWESFEMDVAGVPGGWELNLGGERSFEVCRTVRLRILKISSHVA